MRTHEILLLRNRIAVALLVAFMGFCVGNAMPSHRRARRDDPATQADFNLPVLLRDRLSVNALSAVIPPKTAEKIGVSTQAVAVKHHGFSSALPRFYLEAEFVEFTSKKKKKLFLDGEETEATIRIIVADAYLNRKREYPGKKKKQWNSTIGGPFGSGSGKTVSDALDNALRQAMTALGETPWSTVVLTVDTDEILLAGGEGNLPPVGTKLTLLPPSAAGEGSDAARIVEPSATPITPPDSRDLWLEVTGHSDKTITVRPAKGFQVKSGTIVLWPTMPLPQQEKKK
ncbi:MAG: hypothetical protein SFU56_09540 [Capsulimonadales bacterium]|nr:hypothetical protein [Capsulimonadales bacterium]